MPPFKQISFLLGSSSPRQFPADARPEVAIAGRSNVGKSSLLNVLAGRRQLARTSKTPGRTQQINFFDVDQRFRLVDLPGYGFSRAPKEVAAAWARLIGHYLSKRENLALVIVLLDARRVPSILDHQMIDLLLRHGLRFALVLTKSDKISRSELARQMRQVRETFPDHPVLAVSATQRTGIEELWQVILNAVEPSQD